jgi:tRNA threonylcarbamoyladenosine biosynthesis protein TsaB
MLTLAIETSVTTGTIALERDGVSLAERHMTVNQRHAQRLVPEIHELLEQCSQRPRDCDLIAVSLGPGSFTGLRVGVVCANVLAYALGKPIVGVDTLLAIAGNSPPDVERVQVVVDAQRQELFLGEFERIGADEWRRVAEVRIVPARGWAAGLHAGDVVSGPGLEKVPAEWLAPSRVLDCALWSPQARRIAALGTRAFQRGAQSSFWNLEPLYLRKSAAEEKWDATHGPTD